MVYLVNCHRNYVRTDRDFANQQPRIIEDPEPGH